MDIDLKVKEILNPLFDLTLKHQRKGKANFVYLYCHNVQEFEVLSESAETNFLNLVINTWTSYVSFINSITDKKKKKYALLQGKGIIKSHQINLIHKKFVIRWAGHSDNYFERFYDENDNLIDAIDLIELSENLFQKELLYQIECWLNKIENFIEKFELYLEKNALFDTECPFLLISNLTHYMASKKLMKLFEYMKRHHLIDGNATDFQSIFLGGTVKVPIKWLGNTALFPGFIKELLKSENLIKVKIKKTNYWDYLRERFRNNKGKTFPPSIRYTSNFGSAIDQEKFILEPLDVLR